MPVELKCKECAAVFTVVHVASPEQPLEAWDSQLPADVGCPECWGDLERVDNSA